MVCGSTLRMTQTPNLSISERRADILARIDEAAKRSNRGRETITLVAVSKVQPDNRVDAMLDAGQTVFGENRVQEAQERWSKRKETYPDLQLRLIGPLQTNKVEDAVQLFDVIETLDRPKLAVHLAKAIERFDKSPEILVQVNTGEENQKGGVSPNDLDNFINLVTQEHGLNISGLMCIPPVDEPAGPHFALLRKLAIRNGLQNLSMGMSGDFETAISFGATQVRVGSALFGQRDYR